MRIHTTVTTGIERKLARQTCLPIGSSQTAFVAKKCFPNKSATSNQCCLTLYTSHAVNNLLPFEVSINTQQSQGSLDFLSKLQRLQEFNSIGFDRWVVYAISHRHLLHCSEDISEDNMRTEWHHKAQRQLFTNHPLRSCKILWL